MASPRLQCGKGLPVWHGWKNIGGSQKGICLRNVETGVQSKRLVYLSFPKIQSGGIRAVRQNQRMIRCDVCDIHLLATFIVDLFKPRRRLEVEQRSGTIVTHQSCPDRRAGDHEDVGQLSHICRRYAQAVPHVWRDPLRVPDTAGAVDGCRVATSNLKIIRLAGGDGCVELCPVVSKFFDGASCLIARNAMLAGKWSRRIRFVCDSLSVINRSAITN